MTSVLYYFECKVCGYDSAEARKLSRNSGGICPLCAGDCGHVNNMTFRTATAEEIAALAPRVMKGEGK